MRRSEYLGAVQAFERNGQLLPGSSRARVEHEARVALAPPGRDRRPGWFDRLAALATHPDAAAVTNIIVHGSWGDGTACAYSDVDLTLYLSDDHTRRPDTVNRTTRWMRRQLFPFLVSVDPLQHHGAFLLWDGFAGEYSERVLPVSAYANDRAWSLYPQTLELGLVSDPAERWESIECAERIAAPDRSFFAHGFDRYSFKRLVSNATLLPALFLGDIGEPTHKAESFAAFRARIGTDARLVAEAEAIRDVWVAPGALFSRTAVWTARSRYLYRGQQRLLRPADLRAKVDDLAEAARELVPVLQAVRAR